MMTDVHVCPSVQHDIMKRSLLLYELSKTIYYYASYCRELITYRPGKGNISTLKDLLPYK